MNARLITALVASLALSVAGCGGKAAVSAPATPIRPSPVATTPAVVEHGPDTFLAWMKTADYGDKDFSSATDEQAMAMGNSVCGVLSTQPSFGEAVQVMLKIGKPSVGEAQALVKEAVLDLCPQHKSLVP